MFCGNCGGKVADDAKFCTKCGHQVEHAGPVLQSAGVESGTRVRLPAAAPARAVTPVPPVTTAAPTYTTQDPWQSRSSATAGVPGPNIALGVICGILGLAIAVLWLCGDWIGMEWATVHEVPAQLLLVVCAFLLMARQAAGAAYLGVAAAAVGLITVLVALLPGLSFYGTPLQDVPTPVLTLCGVIALGVGVAAVVGTPLRSTSGAGQAAAYPAALLVSIGLTVEYAGDLLLHLLAHDGRYYPAQWRWIATGAFALSVVLAAIAVWGALSAWRGSRGGLTLATVSVAGTIVTCLVGVWAPLEPLRGAGYTSLVLQLLLVNAVWPAVGTITLAWCARCARHAVAYTSVPERKSPTTVHPGLASPAITFWVTFFFGLFGLIPATMHASRAAAAGASGTPYWKAFGLGVLTTFLLWVLALVALWFVVSGLAAS